MSNDIVEIIWKFRLPRFILNILWLYAMVNNEETIFKDIKMPGFILEDTKPANQKHIHPPFTSAPLTCTSYPLYWTPPCSCFPPSGLPSSLTWFLLLQGVPCINIFFILRVNFSYNVLYFPYSEI